MGHHHQQDQTHEIDSSIRMGYVPSEVLRQIRQRSSMGLNAFSRRDAVRLLGLSGIAALTGCGSGGTFASSSSSGSTGATTTTGSGSTSCTKGLSKTEGPYWVDGDTATPQRSDIRPDAKGTSVSQAGYQGVNLGLSFAVYTYSANGCTPLQNARVDIWHANAQGKYSDESSEGTIDDNWLRGYQLSDASGLVSFNTIFPGWYSGRTPHIHLRVRTYNISGSVATNSTTQVFFNDALSDSIYGASSYYARTGTRDTYNSSDNIYGNASQLLLTLSGAASTGYTGALYGVGLPFGS